MSVTITWRALLRVNYTKGKPMDSYKFGGGEERKVFGPLPPGDYDFTVSECGEPYQKQNGNWVLQVRLAIQPGGETVFATPWSGRDRNGEDRDGIGDFLISVNRAPALGKEPDWRKLERTRGRCRLKIETAQMGALAGKEVNKVAFFHHPKEIVQPAADKQQSVSQEEYNQTLKARRKADPDLEVEPDDIPFVTNIYKAVRTSR